MTTHVTTHNPVRSDVPAHPAVPVTPQPRAAHSSRSWAAAGIAAAVTAVAGGVCAGMVNAVYDPAISDDAGKVLARLGDFVPQLVGFQVFASITALLLAVFGVGLHRRLRASAPAGSLAPAVAGFGLLATSVVMVMGSSLNTEFAFAVANDDVVVPEAAVVYNHWIGTVPACWLLVGLSALAVFAVSRRGDVPRWLGLVGLVLGGLTLRPARSTFVANRCATPSPGSTPSCTPPDRAAAIVKAREAG